MDSTDGWWVMAGIEEAARREVSSGSIILALNLCWVVEISGQGAKNEKHKSSFVWVPER